MAFSAGSEATAENLKAKAKPLEQEDEPERRLLQNKLFRRIALKAVHAAVARPPAHISIKSVVGANIYAGVKELPFEIKPRSLTRFKPQAAVQEFPAKTRSLLIKSRIAAHRSGL
jgi:hypothetical protein